MSKSQDIEYWEKVAQKAYNPQTRMIRDNWGKRQRLMHILFEYDFENMPILEIGCGNGLTAAVLKVALGPYFRYVGTDIASHFCRTASGVFGLKAIHTEPGKPLPFENDSFAFVFLFDVMEHIPLLEQRTTLTSEIRRVLKPGGCVFINNPLSPGSHAEEVEYGFGSLDIGLFAESIEGMIERVTVYTATGRYYQFIAIRRLGGTPYHEWR